MGLWRFKWPFGALWGFKWPSGALWGYKWPFGAHIDDCRALWGFGLVVLVPSNGCQVGAEKRPHLEHSRDLGFEYIDFGLL